MDRCVLLAPAKINLYLEIIGNRPDGFHELVMVMQSVDLCDRLTLVRADTDRISLRCAHPLVPEDETNLAYRAAELMSQQFGDAFARYGGVKIQIEKQIPVGAGLAGGSGNAAAVLVGLNLLWKLGLTRSELETLGAKLGSDVPFCISGGTALATGRGEQITPLGDLRNLYAVLAKYHSLSVSTPWAYKAYRQQFESTYASADDDLALRRERVHSGPMITAISRQDTDQIFQLLTNDLEKVVLPAHPEVEALRSAMAQASQTQAARTQRFQTQTPQNQGVMMSGSGPTVFALARSQADADAIAQSLRAALPSEDLGLWVAPFNTSGIRLVEA
ncbi:MAG: 4-(cytidine 5'-diphospho)-2-C-methyl-D-erythritol kinase [Synechococcales cyanobacterium RM1_1_8]|nr:4-(cytidine 5'-diphospho)-2-C-methyl-D-erythritol kinase [Synechococcales cyanobacterium RM1_1_8]